MKPNRPNNELLRKARECLLLRDLTPLHFNSIIDNSTAVIYKEGDVIFEQDTETSALFFLGRGQVKLTRLAPDGNEKVIDIINEGLSFAEAVVFGGSLGYPVSAIAIVDSEVLCIDAHFYKEFITCNQDASLSLLANMSRRLHWQLNEIDRLTLHTAAYRLALYLLDQIPDIHDGTSEILLQAPKHIIASRLTIKPETFSRTLKKFSEAGLIEVKVNTVIVKDIAKLEAFVELEGKGQQLV